MRRLLLSILLLLPAMPAAASDILIIQSKRLPAYDQAVRLLQNGCAKGSRTLVLSDYAEFDLGRIVREEQPSVVIAVGDQALKEAKLLRRTPVVYTMALNVSEQRAGDNFTGVTMTASPDNYMKLFTRFGLGKVGILYDPKQSGSYLKRARAVAAKSGIELVAIKVHSPREVPASLERLKDAGIDSIWLIPDSTAVAAENIDAYFHLAQKEGVPVIAFAKGYLAKGALAVLEISRQKMAEQACRLISTIGSGMEAAELPDQDVSDASIFINEEVAARLKMNSSGLDQLSISSR